MVEICLECGEALESGQEVYQLALGNYFRGWETPTYSWEPLREWHSQCFSSFPLLHQDEPYYCSLCDDDFEESEKVVYVSHGFRPTTGYTRPERRGYGIQYIAHRRCFARAYPGDVAAAVFWR